MENQTLSAAEAFQKIIEMIEEKPELFDVVTDLCETADHVLKTTYLDR
jgi:hypothetical protein